MTLGMNYNQIRFNGIQTIITAMLAVGAVFISMGTSNINFVESSQLSLLQFETMLALEPVAHEELIDSVNTLRSALEYRMNQAWILLIIGTVLLMGGITIGSIGFYLSKK